MKHWIVPAYGGHSLQRLLALQATRTRFLGERCSKTCVTVDVPHRAWRFTSNTHLRGGNTDGFQAAGDGRILGSFRLCCSTLLTAEV